MYMVEPSVTMPGLECDELGFDSEASVVLSEQGSNCFLKH